jgi:hypothetical protein
MLRPYEMGIGSYSKVNIKYFNTLGYDFITKIAIFCNIFYPSILVKILVFDEGTESANIATNENILLLDEYSKVKLL